LEVIPRAPADLDKTRANLWPVIAAFERIVVGHASSFDAEIDLCPVGPALRVRAMIAERNPAIRAFKATFYRDATATQFATVFNR
jgi:hypothetical protein